MVKVTNTKRYEGFVEIGTTSTEALHGYLCIEKFIETLAEGKYRVRYMKNAYGAWHWGNINKATSQQILQGGLDVALFVGPVERIGCKKTRDYLIPCSCITRDTDEPVPGEILDASELSNRGFFALWATFEDDLKKAIPGYTFIGKFLSRRNREANEDKTCMICLDEPATFAWQECDHKRATICESCKIASENLIKGKLDPSQRIRLPCCYCRTISSIVMRRPGTA